MSGIVLLHSRRCFGGFFIVSCAFVLVFVFQLVLHQLQCGGVLECIRITKAGFPTRRPYAQFAERYRVLDPRLRIPSVSTKYSVRQQCEMVASVGGISPERVRYGSTKVFLKAGMLASLEKKRVDLLRACATTLQATYRAHYHRHLYLRTKHAAIVLQSCKTN